MRAQRSSKIPASPKAMYKYIAYIMAKNNQRIYIAGSEI